MLIETVGIVFIRLIVISHMQLRVFLNKVIYGFMYVRNGNLIYIHIYLQRYMIIMELYHLRFRYYVQSVV